MNSFMNIFRLALLLCALASAKLAAATDENAGKGSSLSPPVRALRGKTVSGDEARRRLQSHCFKIFGQPICIGGHRRALLSESETTPSAPAQEEKEDDLLSTVSDPTDFRRELQGCPITCISLFGFCTWFD